MRNEKKRGSYEHKTVYSKVFRETRRNYPVDKKSYRVRNWRKYNEALVNRGSITFWFDEKCISQWKSKKEKTGRGRPEKYSDLAIQTGLTLKALFKLTFRQTEGFIKSLLQLLKLELDTPDNSLLCKRQKTIVIDLPKKALEKGEKLHLAFDTSGLKVYGEGEWKVRQHGWVKHRLWRKLHLAVNTVNHQIEAFELTDLGVQDCEGVPLLLNQIKEPIDSGRGDGAYDRFSCYEEAEKKDFRLITPPQRNAKLSTERKNKKKAQPDAIKKRDDEIKKIRELGRKEWKVQSGYHRRSLAETAMFRVKTLLGNRLSARILQNQKTEVAIWCQIVNKMTMLGMPNSFVVE